MNLHGRKPLRRLDLLLVDFPDGGDKLSKVMMLVQLEKRKKIMEFIKFSNKVAFYITHSIRIYQCIFFGI